MPRQWHTIALRRADAGPTQAAVEIVCGVCGKSEHAINPSNRKAMPTVWVTNYFAQKGWEVGHKAADDRCPACAATLRAERRSKSETKREKTMAGDTAPMAEQPRQMGFQDKPIILAKLVEVYLDSENGYDRGWSDKRVAEDLGVPRAWVAELRDQNFGPARDNEEIRDFLARVDAHVAKVADVEKRCGTLSAEAVKLASEAREIEKLGLSIRKAVA